MLHGYVRMKRRLDPFAHVTAPFSLYSGFKALTRILFARYATRQEGKLMSKGHEQDRRNRRSELALTHRRKACLPKNYEEM